MKSPKKPSLPKHKARRIVTLINNEHKGWAIYKDQLPAMVEAMAQVIGGTWGWKEHQRINDSLMDAFRADARACLKAIGVEEKPRAGQKRLRHWLGRSASC